MEKKSEFIGACAPVKTEEEAIAFVNSIKKKHSAAKHNVYAYVLRDGFTQRFSDDGEPHGTAGMPVLDSIRKADLTDVAVVVTRYFGGILLGTGGLVRAYTAAASGAVKEAGIAEVGDFSVLEIKANYSDYQKIMPLYVLQKSLSVCRSFRNPLHIQAGLERLVACCILSLRLYVFLLSRIVRQR